jgi:predicted transcriptional regulator
MLSTIIPHSGDGTFLPEIVNGCPGHRRGAEHHMARKPQDVTDAELSILQVLWTRGTATVRELTEQLYPPGTGSDLATVQKLLKRLEGKRCVRRDRSAWPHQFRPAIARNDLIGRRLQTTADELCCGSLEPLVTHLVRHRLTAKQRQDLRRLLSELDNEARSGAG